MVQRSLRVGSGSGAARAVAGVAASSEQPYCIDALSAGCGANRELALVKTLASQRDPREGLSPGRLPVGRLVFMRPTPSAAIPQLPLAASVSQFECFKSLTTKEAALLPSETATAETAATFRTQIVEQRASA